MRQKVILTHIVDALFEHAFRRTCYLTPDRTIGPGPCDGWVDTGEARHDSDEQVRGTQVEEAPPADRRDLLGSSVTPAGSPR